MKFKLKFKFKIPIESAEIADDHKGVKLQFITESFLAIFVLYVT